MSRVKTDNLEGNLLPIPDVKGISRRESFTATASQTIFTLTKFNAGASLKAYNGKNPVTVTWTSATPTRVTINPAAAAGDRIHFYANTEDLSERMDLGESTLTSLNTSTVKKTSNTGAALIPAGTNAQRPTGANGHIRLNVDEGYYEGYINSEWKPLGADSVPMFSAVWFPSRAAIAPGYVAQDGQVLSRATYPTAWAGINAGTVPTVDDATWLADTLQRGKFSTGNGSSTFRLPDLNGKSAGSLGAVFLRGDGALSAAIEGIIQQDELKSHSHTYTFPSVSSFMTFGGVNDNQLVSQVQTGTAQTVAAGAAETRPLNVTGVWAVKLFGAVTNTGSANAAQLATDYANLASRTTILEGKPGVGWDQTYQAQVGTRVLGSTYTNTTGKPIEVHVSVTFTATAHICAVVNGGNIKYFGGSGNLANIMHSVSFTVPAGATYSVTGGSGVTISLWTELR